MNTNLLYFFIAVGIALFIAAFLYFFPRKKNKKPSFLLFALRFLSVLAILTLLINPKWERNELSIHKPQLVVAIDNSASMDYIAASKTVQQILKKIKEDKELNKKFDIDYYSFGERVRSLDSLDFSDTQTNHTLLLAQMDALYARSKSPIILITDGNQTLGSSYQYYPSKNPVYPIFIGDTLENSDLSITQLNVNQYAFLNNTFPVEVFAWYKGANPVQTRLSIYKGKQRVYTKKISFTKDNNTKVIRLKLPANKVGQHFYTARLSAVSEESNLHNNRRDFSVEVIDEQSKILLLSSFYHPDLGAIKKSIESNKQRKVSLKIAGKDAINLSEYQLVIAYQPNLSFKSIFDEIKEKEGNTFIITGTKTDWVFLNSIQESFSKKPSKLVENYQAVYNSSFSEFVMKDIGFDDFSPLKDTFGKIHFNVAFRSILQQKIGGNEVDEPLLASYTKGSAKHMVLFGEGIWRWRMDSKLTHRSYQEFDAFMNSLVQYTASSVQKEQLHLFYEKLCFNNSEQLIKASYVDPNYQVDTKASLHLSLYNKHSKTTTKWPFYLVENQYRVILPNLKAGDYTFQVSVDHQEIKKFGSFKVLDYNIEQQFTAANTKDLNSLANRTGGEISSADTSERILKSMVDNTQFQSIQKSKKNIIPLIDWHWLLAIIILSLSAEWLIRKYRGLV